MSQPEKYPICSNCNKQDAQDFMIVVADNNEGQNARWIHEPVCPVSADEIEEMRFNSILQREERVSREYRKPEYDTVLHKAANQVAAVILLMFVGLLFVLLITTPDERITGRVSSSGAVQGNLEVSGR